MKLYSTQAGIVAAAGKNFATLPTTVTWDAIFSHDDPIAFVEEAIKRTSFPTTHNAPAGAPIQSQEVWAAGVTYYRSRSARMEESRTTGGGNFYDLVYNADRPELFFKATPNRVAGSDEGVRIRGDSRWNVPEPELTLAINRRGMIFGYTIGNDMSSRDIEGENPLYLPQAKVYNRSAALGPCLLLSREELPGDTEISLLIRRGRALSFEGKTTIKQIKRTVSSLAEYLYRDNVFPFGCYLMTGTGIVPPDEVSLQSGDQIFITVEPIGTLRNFVI